MDSLLQEVNFFLSKILLIIYLLLNEFLLIGFIYPNVNYYCYPANVYALVENLHAQYV